MNNQLKQALTDIFSNSSKIRRIVFNTDFTDEAAVPFIWLETDKPKEHFYYPFPDTNDCKNFLGSLSYFYATKLFDILKFYEADIVTVFGARKEVTINRDLTYTIRDLYYGY